MRLSRGGLISMGLYLALVLLATIDSCYRLAGTGTVSPLMSFVIVPILPVTILTGATWPFVIGGWAGILVSMVLTGCFVTYLAGWAFTAIAGAIIRSLRRRRDDRLFARPSSHDR